MKKALVILSFIAAAISLSSCHIEGATIRTEEYFIEHGAWQISNGTDPKDVYLYVTCEADFINKKACEDGSVNAYLWLEGSKCWTPLPYLSMYPHTSGMSTTIIAENIRFEYAPGEITFIVQDMDGLVPDPLVDDYTFRVTVTR